MVKKQKTTSCSDPKFKAVSCAEAVHGTQPAQSISVQREYIALVNVKPHDEEQKIFTGNILPEMQIQNISPMDIIYFSRDYCPETNDMDKVFTEVRFGDEVVGQSFIMVPFNKVRLVITPQSLIQIAKTAPTRKIQI